MVEKIESFTLDHRLVDAPYVRKAGVKNIGGGGQVIKYDVRFTQPNIEPSLSTAAVHSIEHSLATALREHTTGVIDLSPMGCRTGFYVVVDASVLPDWDTFVALLVTALEDVLLYENVPGAVEEECGNYLDHSLSESKQAIKNFLQHKNTLHIIYKKLTG